MDDTKEVAAALHSLVESDAKARTKIGRLRQLLPEIDALQEAGVSHAKILEVLNTRGFELTMSAYSVMLWRIRNPKAKQKFDAKPIEQQTQHAIEAPPVERVDPPSITPDINETTDEARRRREQKANRFINPNSNNLLKNLKGNK